MAHLARVSLLFPSLCALLFNGPVMGQVQFPQTTTAPAWATTTGVRCQIPKPNLSVLSWQGQAAYVVNGTVKSGHVVDVRITAQDGRIDRYANRAMIRALDDAVRLAKCTLGDYTFEQSYVFNIAAPSPASSAASGM